MKAGAYWMVAIATALSLSTVDAAVAAAGQATVIVETVPPVGGRTLTFDGTPAGSLTLGNDGSGSLSMEVGTGNHASTLSRIDARLSGAGYRLVRIECDDTASATVSQGDVAQRRATFAVDSSESVTCTFTLQKSDSEDGDGGPGSTPPGPGEGSACICPMQGRWGVDNHTGSMDCSGSFNISAPLPAQHDSGSITVNEDCTRIHADSLGEDEADIDMELQPDCSWKGSVGGERDGIPMIIHFRWNVASKTRIVGDLYSNVSERGMTCIMKRTYELDFEG